MIDTSATARPPRRERDMGVFASCVHSMDGLVQNCSNSIALAMELLQFCTSHRYDLYAKVVTSLMHSILILCYVGSNILDKTDHGITLPLCILFNHCPGTDSTPVMKSTNAGFAQSMRSKIDHNTKRFWLSFFRKIAILDDNIWKSSFTHNEWGCRFTWWHHQMETFSA